MDCLALCSPSAQLEKCVTRNAVYQQAREAHPARWSGETRNWSPVDAVTLNPERDCVMNANVEQKDIQPLAA